MLIVIDAVRARNLGCYGFDRETSPNIDKIASEGLIYERCFSQSNRTEPSLATIMSGKHPLNHRITSHGTKYTEENFQKLEKGNTKFLSEILKEEGYRTIAIDWLNRWHNRGYNHYGVKQTAWKGFRWKVANILRKIASPLWNLAVKTHRKTLGSFEHRANCERVTKDAMKQIEKSEKEFFLFLHYWDTHAPYYPQKEHHEPFKREGGPTLRELKEEENLNIGPYSHTSENEEITLSEIKSRYEGCIHWVDYEIGRLFNWLESQKLLDDTLIIITSDHGENFGEKGIYFTHAGLYDVTIHVPLIIWHENSTKNRIRSMVQHTDILPTITNILNLKDPLGLDGRPLNRADRNEIYVESNKSKLRAIRTDKWKLIQPINKQILEEKADWYGSEMKSELYNLEKDPEEENNLADSEKEKFKELSEKIDEKVREFKRKNEKSRISSKIKNLLKNND